ncbi:serine/threonine-protein kinase [Streptomyces sp. NPDC059605]|uniref:serine/threonine-protein kinase n=1 Tax=unclassified Streptomyces TaxID=2593676 RepID=UPI0036A1CA5F
MSTGGGALGAPGSRIGSYTIERKLGEGGMGSVYLARSRGGRAVAVKVARSELAADPVFRERFLAEVAAARAVGGFHTAPVVDADPDTPTPWLATAYVPGPTLAEFLRVRGPMDERALRALGAGLAEALEAIHRCGLVHRDLKPGNIIMADDGPRVLDFGIARAVESTRLTATGHAFGTPGFLAPEQATGDEVTGAADVFALGAVLVAAAGGSPFGGGTPMGMMYRTVHEPANLDAVPDGVRHVAAACLAKEPERRPTTDRLLDWFEAPAERTEGGEGPGTDPRRLLASDPTPPPTPVRGPDPGPAPAPAPVSQPLPTPTPDPVPVAQAATYVPTRLDMPPRPAHAPHVSAPHTPASEEEEEEEEVFIAADSDSSILVDADGVMFTLYRTGAPDRGAKDEDPEQSDVEAEFAWSEIADVTGRTVRRTRLLVTLALHDGSSYSCEINARRATHIHTWHQGLAGALRRYLRR